MALMSGKHEGKITSRREVSKACIEDRVGTRRVTFLKVTESRVKEKRARERLLRRFESLLKKR